MFLNIPPRNRSPSPDPRKSWAPWSRLPGVRPYTNEDIRNLNIWEKTTSVPEARHIEERYNILAGFYQGHPDQTACHFTNEEVYKMMDIIFGSHEGFRYLLLQLPADPRISGFPSDDDLLLLPRVKREYRMKGYTGSVIESMTPGHYTLVQYSVDSFGTTNISPLKKYTFLDPIVKTRSVTRDSSAGSGKLTPSRLSSVVVNVRQRDGRCRISGEGAPLMARGYNFGGFEVAHIVPVAYGGQMTPEFRSLRANHFSRL